MKGKKIDNLFVNNFLSECVLNNKTSVDQIIDSAQSQIDQIDQQLKKIQDLKELRSKLLDVIYTFKKSNKNKDNLEHILSLFKISYPNVCKKILYKIKNNTFNIKDYLDKEDKLDIIFALKQLIEYKVILNKDDFFYPGDFFNEYLIFVLKEG